MTPSSDKGGVLASITDPKWPGHGANPGVKLSSPWLC